MPYKDKCAELQQLLFTLQSELDNKINQLKFKSLHINLNIHYFFSKIFKKKFKYKIIRILLKIFYI